MSGELYRETGENLETAHLFIQSNLDLFRNRRPSYFFFGRNVAFSCQTVEMPSTWQRGLFPGGVFGRVVAEQRSMIFMRTYNVNIS